jgi:hypothetical protein
MPAMIFEGQAAARLADYAGCAFAVDIIVEGSASVLIGGLPAARVTDKTVHGGVVTGPGANSVFIGGPVFALPKNLAIKGPPEFQNKVVRDLYALWLTPSGKDLFRRLEDAGKELTIVPFEKQNGTNLPNDWLLPKEGSSNGSIIEYNPEHDWAVGDDHDRAIPNPPQIVLAHELCHGLAEAEGRAPKDKRVDPKPPGSEPTIPEIEAQAIGTGSHREDYPSENSFRSDLGLPRRDSHKGAAGPMPYRKLRPGGY